MSQILKGLFWELRMELQAAAPVAERERKMTIAPPLQYATSRPWEVGVVNVKNYGYRGPLDPSHVPGP